MEKQESEYKPVSFIKVFTITLYVWVTLAIITSVILLLLLGFTDFNFNKPGYKSYETEKYDFERASEAMKQLEQNK